MSMTENRPTSRARLRLQLAAFLGLGLLILSCVPAPSERAGSSSAPGAPAGQPAPKVLRIGQQAKNEPTGGVDGPASPAPYGGSGSGSAALEHFFTFHASLTIFDEESNIVPMLAQKVPSIDDG